MSDSAPTPRPPRRPRYRGKNPRRFEEKYKERDPQRYGETIAKVLASGKTPAGTHRPVMVQEILEVLAPEPGAIAVDCTLGYGGHAQEILARISPGGRLLGLDADPIELPKTEARLRSLGYGPEVFSAHRSNFAGLPKVLAKAGLTGADLILADLGVSSMQIDDPSRGFSTKQAGPLDMRMNPARGQSASAFPARHRCREARPAPGRKLRRTTFRTPRRRAGRQIFPDHAFVRHRHPVRALPLFRRSRRTDRPPCFPGAPHCRERRVLRARLLVASAPLVSESRRPRRHPHLPFRRRSPRKEILRDRSRRRSLFGNLRRRHPPQRRRAKRQSSFLFRKATMGPPLPANTLPRRSLGKGGFPLPTFARSHEKLRGWLAEILRLTPIALRALKHVDRTDHSLPMN